MSLIGPDDNQMKLIQKEVNETDPKKAEDNFRLVKEWMDCQPHVPKKYDDRIFPMFLRGCKHDLKRTKRKLEMYYTVRVTLPEFFTRRNPHSTEIVTAIKVMNAVPLPRLTPDGYRVTMHKITTSNVAQFEPCDIYKSLCMLGDIRIIEECPIAGDVFIFDVGNITLGHLSKLANPQLKKILHCIQEAYPQRLKEIHVINCPSYIDKVVNVFKMFMKEKMRNRFHFHTGYRSVYEFVPQSILPEEYGGDAKSLDQLLVQWIKKIESYTDWFAEQENVKCDISRRPRKSSIGIDESMSQFGTEGAFRKLNID